MKEKFDVFFKFGVHLKNVRSSLSENGRSFKCAVAVLDLLLYRYIY